MASLYDRIAMISFSDKLKQWMLDKFVNVSGDTMTGNLKMGTNKIEFIDPERTEEPTNKGVLVCSTEKANGNGIQLKVSNNSGSDVYVNGVREPRSNNDAANKSYVDGIAHKVYTCLLSDDHTELSAPSNLYANALSAIQANNEVYLKVSYPNDDVYDYVYLQLHRLEDYNDVRELHFDGTFEIENITHTMRVNVTSAGSVSFTEDILDDRTYIQDLLLPHPVYDCGTGEGLYAIQKKESALTDTDWQLTDLDLEDYKRIKCYFRSGSGTNLLQLTTAIIIEMDLDARAKSSASKGIYTASAKGCCPNDFNVEYQVSVALSADKTKFAILQMQSLYGTTTGDRGADGRYLYKIEGYKY